MKASEFKPSRLEKMTDRLPKEVSWTWLVNFIKSEALKNNTDVYRQRLAELEATDSDQKRKELKDQLGEIKRRTGGFFPHATFRGGREAEHVVDVSNHVMVDLDKIPQDQFASVRQRLKEWEYTFLLYTTYSGRGLRVIVRIDGEYTVRQFRRVWSAVNDMVEQLVGVKADRQCGDITRFSGLAYDPNVFFNPDSPSLTLPQGERTADASSLSPSLSQGEGAKLPSEASSLPLGGRLEGASVTDRVRHMVESNGCLYREGHHNEYISNCMYLMNKFGVPQDEALSWGLREFHDYKKSDVRSIVRSCYRKTAEHGILSMTNQQSTFNNQHSKCCNVANVASGNFSPHTRADNNVEDMEVDMPQPPTFPAYQWPRLLQIAIDCVDGSKEELSNNAKRDLLLLGAITVLGASLSPYVRFLYGKRWMFPCLQVLGVAPPASGKGVLTWVRRLVEPIHERLLAQYRKAMETYVKEKAAFDMAGRAKGDMKQPEQPPLKMFLIAGNNSATGVLENLMDAKGVGLMCESEADTVSTAIGTDYGHWSDTLRKAFDHDRIAYNRRANKEYREVDSLRLSVLLSGTPAQVKPLIPSAENGLFSRQLFYSLPASDEWQSQFSETDGDDVDSMFKQWGKDWSKLIDVLSRSVTSITFSLSSDQRKQFDKTLADLFASAASTQDGAMKSWVARLAINLMRVMSVVAFLRLLDEGWGDNPSIDNIKGLSPAKGIAKENIKDGTFTRYEYAITDDDFHAVMSLTRPLYLHANYILSLLPKTEVVCHKLTAGDALLMELGNEFTTEEALEAGKRMGLCGSTIRSRLSRMVADGVLKTPSRGIYVLARVCGKN